MQFIVYDKDDIICSTFLGRGNLLYLKQTLTVTLKTVTKRYDFENEDRKNC
jgi:hypothetical protein